MTDILNKMTEAERKEYDEWSARMDKEWSKIKEPPKVDIDDQIKQERLNRANGIISGHGCGCWTGSSCGQCRGGGW